MLYWFKTTLPLYFYEEKEEEEKKNTILDNIANKETKSGLWKTTPGLQFIGLALGLNLGLALGLNLGLALGLNLGLQVHLLALIVTDIYHTLKIKVLNDD